MSLLKRLMTAAFRQTDIVTRFLTDMFKSPEQYKFRGEEVQIDAVRGKEEYAIDVAPYAGGRANKANIFTTKVYKPPAYDEYIYLTAERLNKRLPGKSPYDIAENYAMDITDLIVEDQILIRDKIHRAIELQCRDALVNGKITLINGDIIDFKQKSTHQYSTPTPWTSSTADPFNDFTVVGSRVRADASKAIVDAFFGETALQKFLNNDNVKQAGDIKMIERLAITSPMARQEGADYHGTFSAGSYKINIWTYPQVVGIPLGFSLPNEGTKVPYIPTDRIVILPAEPDFRLYYAGIPSLTDRISPELRGITGLDAMPSIETGDMIPYFRLDKEAEAIKIGVKSRPLAIPVGIDEAIIITVT